MVFFNIEAKAQYFPICKLISCCYSTEGMGEFIMVEIHLEMHKHEVLHKPRKQHIGLMAHGLPAGTLGSSSPC